MKKLFGFMLICFVALSLSLVYAQDSLTPETQPSGDVGQKATTNLQNVENITGGIMDQEITLPEPFDNVIRLLFNLDRAPSLQEFIILLGGFIVLFLVIADVLGFIPNFDKPVIKYIAAFVIVLIIAIFKGLDIIKVLLMGFLNLFNSKIASVLAIIISIVAIFFVLKWLKKMKEKSEVVKAESEGIEVGTGAAILKEEAKLWK